jgi:AcrR family transcriptional regulator
MQKLTALKSQTRGRPPAQRRRQVVQDLIEATEHGLAGKTAKEITIREIATAAGTSESMIRYYFGSKDGLLIAMIHDIMMDAPYKRHQEISKSCVSIGSIRPLVDELCDFHYSRPNLIKMIAVELLGSPSNVKEEYTKRYGHSINLLVIGIIDAMKDAKIYRDSVNSTFVAMSLIRLVVAPLMESAVTGALQMPPEIGSGDWAAFIASTVDSISI